MLKLFLHFHFCATRFFDICLLRAIRRFFALKGHLPPYFCTKKMQEKMKRTKHLAATAAALLISHCAISADSGWGISTDLAAWMRLCTTNISVHRVTGQHTSTECTIEYNPFEFNSRESGTKRLRSLTPQIAVSYWPGSPFDGPYAKSKALWSVYNAAGTRDGSFPEGTLAGLGLEAGWCFRIREWLAFDAGLGAIAYYHNTTYYAGAHCGRILNRKKGFGIYPLDCNFSIIFLIQR